MRSEVFMVDLKTGMFYHTSYFLVHELKASYVIGTTENQMMAPPLYIVRRHHPSLLFLLL